MISIKKQTFFAETNPVKREYESPDFIVAIKRLDCICASIQGIDYPFQDCDDFGMDNIY